MMFLPVLDAVDVEAIRWRIAIRLSKPVKIFFWFCNPNKVSLTINGGQKYDFVVTLKWNETIDKQKTSPGLVVMGWDC